MVEDNVLKVIVLDFRNIFSSFRSNTPVSVEPLYRVAYAKLPNSNVELTIYDEDFKISRGYNELCLRKPSKNFKDTVRGSSSWRVMGQLFIPTTPFDVKSKIKEVDWSGVLDYLVDDTGKKSRELTDIVKSHIIPCENQRINNHAIILTQTNTGKTTSYEKISGVEPSTDVSIAGLFGSIESSNVGYRAISGCLEGGGLIVFDEFPEYSYTVVNKMLNYLESGETTRKLVVPVECKGSKTVVFLGNFNNFSESDFLSSIIGLATGRALDRVGRRFGHVIYEKLDTIEKPPMDYKKIFNHRILVRFAVDEAKAKIEKIFQKKKRWVGRIDKEYKEDVLEVAGFCRDERARLFLKGCSIQSSRVKCGAIKRAIAEHLDKLILKRGYLSVFKNFIEPDIIKFYTDFKDYNLMSYSNFKFNKLLMFKKHYRKGMGVKELERLSERIGVSLRTIYRWRKFQGKISAFWEEI